MFEELKKMNQKETEADKARENALGSETNQQTQRCKGTQRQEVTQSMTKERLTKIKQEITKLNAYHDTLEVLVG